MRLIDADAIKYHGGPNCQQWTTAEEIAQLPTVQAVTLGEYNRMKQLYFNAYDNYTELLEKDRRRSND